MGSTSQFVAPNGFKTLRAGVRYHRITWDREHQRVIIASFHGLPRPHVLLDILPSDDFELGLVSKAIVHCPEDKTMPPWLQSIEDRDPEQLDAMRSRPRILHRDATQRRWLTIKPLLDEMPRLVLEVNFERALNRLIRTIKPTQNETRARLWFFTYLAFGHDTWALLPANFHTSEAARKAMDTVDASSGDPSIQKKRGRPSLEGKDQGYNCTPAMVKACVDGYKKHSREGGHWYEVYEATMTRVFKCIPKNRNERNDGFYHPTGNPFPSIHQFKYHVRKAIGADLVSEGRLGTQGHRNKKAAPVGSHSQEVANLMERCEADAYSTAENPKALLAENAAPKLYVVRLICVASGMIVGIGFSYGSETTEAYLGALFCAAMNKVEFCALFGISISEEDWPSKGLPTRFIPDRGPGASASVVVALKEVTTILSMPPSYAPQTHGSVEATHPRSTAIRGRHRHKLSRHDVIGLARGEILDVIRVNESADRSRRLTPAMANAGVVPTPDGIWRYLDHLGRNDAQQMSLERAIRAFLSPVTFTLVNGSLWLEELRYDSKELRATGVLGKLSSKVATEVEGFVLSMCVRNAWVNIKGKLIKVQIVFPLRGPREDEYLPLSDLVNHSKCVREFRRGQETRKAAATARLNERHAKQIGGRFGASRVINGRSKARSPASQREINNLARRGTRRGHQ